MRNVSFRDYTKFSKKQFPVMDMCHNDDEMEMLDLLDVAMIAHDVYCNEVGCDIDEAGFGVSSIEDWESPHHQIWLKIAIKFIESGISVQDLIDAHDLVMGSN